MKKSGYIESTVISYAAARPSQDIIVAAHQKITREWWTQAANRFELFVSFLVVDEISAGNPEAVRERLKIASKITRLELTPEALKLASRLIESKAIPRKAENDALHIALSATNGLDYLITWNCRHIANAVMRTKIEETCKAARYRPPVICTPEELMEIEDVD